MHAKRLGPMWLHGLLTVALAVGAAGCGEPTGGEFKAYDELDGHAPTSAADNGEKDQPSRPDAADDDDPSADASADGRPTRPAIADSPADSPADSGRDDPDETRTVAASDDDQPAPDADEPSPTGGNGTSPEPARTVAAVGRPDPEIRPLGNGGPLPADRPSQAGPSSDSDDDDPPEPREVRLLVPHREFRTEGPEGALRISYDDIDLLKILNMEPVTPDAPSLMPGWLKNLDGQRVRVRGFMYPTFQETGIERFILARDNDICCFGRDPKIYDLIRVTLRAGKTTHYIEGRPFDVVGIFRIQPAADDDKLYQLYQLEDAVVIQR